MVDDTGGQVFSRSFGARMSSAMMASILQAQADTVNNLIEQIQFNGIYPSGGTNGSGGFQFNYNFSFDTNGLWLEASNEATTLGLRLHNTVGGDNYQLLSISKLLNSHWDLGEILFVLGQFAGFGDNFFKVNL